jgi:hypothetical protein
MAGEGEKHHKPEKKNKKNKFVISSKKIFVSLCDVKFVVSSLFSKSPFLYCKIFYYKIFFFVYLMCGNLITSYNFMLFVSVSYKHTMCLIKCCCRFLSPKFFSFYFTCLQSLFSL